MLRRVGRTFRRFLVVSLGAQTGIPVSKTLWIRHCVDNNSYNKNNNETKWLTQSSTKVRFDLTFAGSFSRSSASSLDRHISEFSLQKLRHGIHVFPAPGFPKKRGLHCSQTIPCERNKKVILASKLWTFLEEIVWMIKFQLETGKRIVEKRPSIK